MRRLDSKRPRLKRVALFPGRTGDKSGEHVASFNEQRDPQAKPEVIQYFGKTAVNNKLTAYVYAYQSQGIADSANSKDELLPSAFASHGAFLFSHEQ